MGVRRTIPVPAPAVWSFLTGEGISLWLGDAALPATVGAEYRTAQGVAGRIRGWTEGRRVRLTWRPEHWDHDSTFQLTVIPVVTGSTIALHHERLADEGEREHMLAHWRAVLDTVTVHLVPALPAEE